MSSFQRGSSRKSRRKNAGSRKNKSSKQSEFRFTTKTEARPIGLSSDVCSKNEYHVSSISELPLEILDVILQRSYLLCVLRARRIKLAHDSRYFHHRMMPTTSTATASNRMEDKDIIVKLASVDFCWFQRITKRKFKKRRWRYLAQLYRRHEKGAVIIRANKRYLLNTIKSDELFVSRLLFARCITETQMALINKLQRYRDRNAMLLRAICFRDDKVYLSFVKCLHDTNQHLVAGVAEHGGVVAEVKVRNRKIPNRKLVEQQLTGYLSYGYLSYFRDKSKSPEVGKILDLLKMYEMEILQTYKNKGIVMWLWCKTKEALQKFQQMSQMTECNSLRDILSKLFKYLSSNTERHLLVPRDINVDKDVFTREVVTVVYQKPVVVRFSARLEGKEFEHVTGITKLGNEIYFLCRSHYSPESNSILVFEDHTRFRQQRMIEISQIKRPFDIGSNVNERCLYVADEQQGCVWKISEEIGLQVTKWLSGLGALYSVSFCCSSGQLLIVKPRDPLSILEVYSPGAKRIHSVQLIADIQKPRHAVETSGSFIVVHEWRDGPDKRWMQVVSEVSTDGSMVLRRFVPGHRNQELNEPVYLSLDSDDQVFVADKGRNGKVVLLDSDLRWNQILCPNKNNTEQSITIIAPWRLCYDVNKQQLMVAVGTNAKEGGVNVYTLHKQTKTIKN